MAMVRGRKLQSKTAEEIKLENRIKGLRNFGKEKKKPTASLKQQQRLTMVYSETSNPLNTPIPDVDPFYANKDIIFRFSAEKSLFLFGKDSKLRQGFLRILVHRWFNYIVIATILVNCVVMMVNGNNKPEWSELYVENVFLFIYTTEAIVKIIGRGLVLHPFSYLRDPWNWLDFTVIVSAYVLLVIAELGPLSDNVGSLAFLRAVRVLRIFKTVSVIPGLRMIVSALVASTKALKDAMLLSLLGFSMFSLVGIQAFRGTLKSKCVLRPPWMIPTLLANFSENGECPPNGFADETISSKTAIKHLQDCCRRDIYNYFGKRVYQEMEFFTWNWYSSFCNQSISDSHEQYVATTDETERYEFQSSGGGSSGEFDDSIQYINWTYRREVVDEFNETGYQFNWKAWIEDESHHVMNGFIPMLCGNASNAVKCLDISVCVKAGSNPNFGYTNFDNFPYAFLSVFRLSLQDNWEELYLQVLDTSGHLAVFFFLIMIFLGSYYMVNLILAVVATAYEDQTTSVEVALAEERRIKINEQEYLSNRRKTRAENNVDIEALENNATLCFGFKEVFLEWRCCVGDCLFCIARATLKWIFTHPKAEMVVVGLVVLNTMVMMLEQEPKNQALGDFMSISNMVFNILFTVEMVGKMLALSPYHYFAVAWNTFDFVVVTLSLIEMIMSDKLPDGLAVLRTFRLIRLVRILKLARSWPTLSKIMSMIADSLSKMGYLTLVLLIVLIIFALAGMQIVGVAFHIDKTRGIPLRWHMNDFVHSFLIVFRIQCGEWIQSMWSCMHSVSENGRGELVPFCLLIFLGAVFVGNLVVLNLFLALLLNSFSGADLSGGSKSGKAQKFLKTLKLAKITSLSKMKIIRNRVHPTKSENNGENAHRVKSKEYQHRRSERATNSNANVSAVNADFVSVSLKGISNNDDASCHVLSTGQKNMCSPDLKQHTIESDNNISSGIYIRSPSPESFMNAHFATAETDSVDFSKTLTISSKTTADCSSNTSTSKSEEEEEKRSVTSPSGENDGTETCRVRLVMNSIVSHWLFETFIIFCIMCSSIALVFEDVNLPRKPTLKAVLEAFDKVFMTIFFIEMVMKWIGYGFKKYFTSGWCILDFFIVMISLVSLALETYQMTSNSSSTNLSFLRVLRSLRAFRPLRAMSRFKGIKVVTDALFRSIPSILNVFLICVVFWLVFAIMGVNLFAGKMSACRWKETGEKVWHPDDFQKWANLSDRFVPSPINVRNKADCDLLANLTNGKVHWKNLYANFDNTLIAYLSLMQVATFKGWMPIMYAAVDVPSRIGDQPVYENAVENYFFFVAFIIFGGYFTLNLFISVVIDNFNQQKSKFEYKGGHLFLTETQKKAYDMLKKLTARTPNKLIPVPRFRWRRWLYFVVTGEKFELGIMIVTLINLAVLALEHDNMSTGLMDGVEYLNYAFLIFFSLEIIFRIVAMGSGFFRSPWNVYDFAVIGASVLVNVYAMVRYSVDGSLPIKSPWLPMLRMIRIARILRVARVASGIRTLLFALVLSLPALFNVGSLLFLFVFIYAIFGMSQFGHVEHKAAITDILNFETFPNAFMLLFQMSTSAGWDGFLEPTLYVDPDTDGCVGELNEENRTVTCMKSSAIGYIYFSSYLILTFVIITNMYIAIILENFDLAKKDSTEPLTADDFEHYFDVWQKYDKDGSGKLTVEQLSDLLHSIDRPLRIEKPNIDKIACLEIPLDKNNQMHILDVATSLIKNILEPYDFTDEMKSEVESHFRKKGRALMTNYKRQENTTTFEYAKDRMPVRQDPVSRGSETSTSEREHDFNNSNRYCRIDIPNVLHASQKG